jgi:hypothetical protein
VTGMSRIKDIENYPGLACRPAYDGPEPPRLPISLLGQPRITKTTKQPRRNDGIHIIPTGQKFITRPFMFTSS